MPDCGDAERQSRTKTEAKEKNKINYAWRSSHAKRIGKRHFEITVSDFHVSAAAFQALATLNRAPSPLAAHANAVVQIEGEFMIAPVPLRSMYISWNINSRAAATNQMIKVTQTLSFSTFFSIRTHTHAQRHFFGEIVSFYSLFYHKIQIFQQVSNCT